MPTGGEPCWLGSTRNVGRWILNSFCRRCNRQLQEAKSLLYPDDFSARQTQCLRWNWAQPCTPVSTLHQVGQIQLTLPRQRTQIVVALEKVEQFGGVGHPKGQSAADGLLSLWGKYSSRVRINHATLIYLQLIFWVLAWMTFCIMATILLVIWVTRCDCPLTWEPRRCCCCCCRANRPAV